MHNKKILIVDDDRDFVHLVGVLCQAHHYAVEAAYSGAEGLLKSKNKPDLILLDRSLKDMDGLEVCREIRSNPQLRNISIIILSGRDLPSERVEGLYIGADDYVTKPFEPEELIARIEAALRRNVYFVSNLSGHESLAHELEYLLSNKLVVPLFQPIFSTKALEPIGVEVCAHPPVGGFISSPQILLGAALSSGKYFEFEASCWQKAISHWRQRVHRGKLFLSCCPPFIENPKIKDVLETLGGSPWDQIMLEVKECLLIEDRKVFLERLEELRGLGIKIAVDDLGSGCAEARLIEDVKPDFVKIDAALIGRIHQDEFKRKVVESIGQYCSDRNIETIAEGVNDSSDFTVVSDLGIQAVQGDLLARPTEEISPALFMKKGTF
jgi:EAL domain-containing protein (putative c-di-GMP-specific phosphodiesterase class I)/CheY-like chemotaxis protein